MVENLSFLLKEHRKYRKPKTDFLGLSRLQYYITKSLCLWTGNPNCKVLEEVHNVSVYVSHKLSVTYRLKWVSLSLSLDLISEKSLLEIRINLIRSSIT